MMRAVLQKILIFRQLIWASYVIILMIQLNYWIIFRSVYLNIVKFLDTSVIYNVERKNDCNYYNLITIITYIHFQCQLYKFFSSIITFQLLSIALRVIIKMELLILIILILIILFTIIVINTKYFSRYCIFKFVNLYVL